MAAYYGLSSLSYPAVLRALMKEQALQRTLGVGDCEAMSLIYLDNVHPGAVGELAARTQRARVPYGVCQVPPAHSRAAYTRRGRRWSYAMQAGYLPER